ncbi:hypothetical protein BATDEDRAFT_22884 [Batrachochytrium dendrobatidis JAM81]|uniref:Uncharacterized protein n=2 Tax=Batrachochytrium dendrobatidis TaxID=109871 RepID=F4NW32_BATDJ|nr:uncharacterized protein BATDEDRAFT_22884 [Batrachochytrium dendrobatidis JAM81]EGF82760.1 hypothetical protein BATDEDRAFT_22884 [Batrachochytrium dendrobatidis JAM81]OAJ39712.1 hypothetical protein BDEG_23541 [Batrachochytrium dendrobatidis JEL423]|eukprot:XP_006676658.1 hypothetical protein BATDEDRAFT_22884 [Batrachochytrium dendrobatidis JAM81]
MRRSSVSFSQTGSILTLCNWPCVLETVSGLHLEQLDAYGSRPSVPTTPIISHSKNMFTPIEVRQPTRLLVIDTKQFDIDHFIREAVITHAIKPNRELQKVLDSIEFENFLKAGVLFVQAFIREQLVRAQEQASKSWNNVPPAFIRQVNEISKQELFSIEGISSADACHETKTKLHNFSLSYCFLLLYNSRKSHGLAKERYHFEGIYNIAISFVKSTLSAHSLDQVIDHELNFLFRSPLFATLPTKTMIDPIQQQFISAIRDLQSCSNKNGTLQGHSNNPLESMGMLHFINLNRRDSSSLPCGKKLHDGMQDLPSNQSFDPLGSALKHNQNSRCKNTHASSLPRMGGVGKWGNYVGTSRHNQKLKPMHASLDTSSNFMQLSSTEGIGAAHSSGHPGSTLSSSVRGRSRVSSDINTLALNSRPNTVDTRHKRISLNDVRMLRSPLANETLPPVQRFLFVQSRPEAISSVVG